MDKDIDKDLINAYGEYFIERRSEFPNQAPTFRPYRFGMADQWLERLTNLFLAFPRNYLFQHRELIVELAKEIREKKNYYFFLDCFKAIEKRFNLPFPLYIEEMKEARPTLPSFLLTELLLVWALMEKDGKLLVCVRDGFQRKRFPLPENDDLFNRKKAIIAIGHHLLAALPFLTPKDLDLIPDRFGPLEGIDPIIKLPIFNQTIEEVLTDAKTNQRYTIHPDGMVVQWRKNSADLKEMFIKVIDGVVIAKCQTTVGGTMGTMAFLNLATAQGLDFIIHNEGPKNPLALNLAAVYHKLVTAKEIRAGKETRLEIPTVRSSAEVEFVKEEPTVIYIPRTIVVEKGGLRKIQKVLPRQLVYRESPRDHARRLKRGKMSIAQRRKVEDFERVKGVNVLDWLQPGWTYVLPRTYVLPSKSKRKVIYVATSVEPNLINKSEI